MNPKPRWRKGPPNKPGWWLVEESTKDVVAWWVEWDLNEDTGKCYLRYSDTDGSEPIAYHHDRWPVRRSYGPVQEPRKRKAWS